CYMAGNSLGGFITWNYAAAHPEQVKKIILIDAAGYPFKRPPMMAALAGNKLITWLAPKLSSRFIVNASMRQVYGDPSKITDSVAERYYELSMRAGNRASFMAFINHFREVDTNAIKTIKAPTLIMWGEKDRWIPLVDAEKFHRDIAGSQVITYPGVGHIPMEEDANQTVADALHFFDTVNDSTLAVQ
ncbi:MAG TPA: alpha/beta hydrolase, partial [Chitinophagales bacterium]|nr:alpha/beta hydrolase [Chitinophagales bacterium]